MRKIETAMVAAIREAIADPYCSGPIFRQSNTTVFQTGNGAIRTPNFSRWIEVILYETVVALIEPQAGRLSLYSGGFRTATTKSRLNAILESMGDGFYIAQNKGQWGIYKGGYFYEPFYEGRPFTLRP